MGTPETLAFHDLRFADLATFLKVHETESVTSAARELGVTPSQVSKAITRVERVVGATLFTRRARGLALSPAGLEVIGRFERAVQALASVDRSETWAGGELAFAAPSSLLRPILPRIAEALPGPRVRGIDFPPALLRRYAADGLFHVAAIVGSAHGFPPKWSTVRVGELRKSVFASPAIAKKLGSKPTPAQVGRVPFVGPVAYDGGKLVSSPDDCPLGAGERHVAVEVDTMDLALQVAARRDLLVFGPVISAQRELREGNLVEIKVRGWDVSDGLFIMCDAERVLARVQKTIVAVVKEILDAAP